jgi:uncharacterized integral membrane protein (TIGR00698 family)
MMLPLAVIRAHLARLDGQRVRAVLPGMALCGVVALAASAVAGLHRGPPMLYALLFGSVFHYHSLEARTAPGIDWCARHALRLGIGLLGARITAAQITALGGTTAALVVAAVLATLAFGWMFARRLQLPHQLGVLAGGATAICGASAALAIAAVLPRHPDLERHTGAVVVLATLLSSAAMLGYPLLARALDLPPALAGLFLGGSIHDVAQVVVAGYALGPEAGDAATIVKLLRVSLLAVVVVVVGLAARHLATPRPAQASDDAAAPLPPLLPGFLWLFLALVILHSAGVLPATAQQGLAEASRAALVLVVVGLGMRTSFRHLARTGWRPALLMLATTLWLGALMLGLAWWLHRS